MTDQNSFRDQPFVAVSGNPGGKVPFADDVLSSHQPEIFPSTSLDENSIEFEFRTDRNVYVDLRQTFLALKIKLAKDCGFDTYKTTEKKKEHKEDTVFTETGDDDVEFLEEGGGVPHITHVNNNLHSIFSNAELYIKNHQIYNLKGLYAHKSDISSTSKSTLIDFKSCIVKGMIMKKFQRSSRKVHFSLEEWKFTVDLTVSWGTLSSASTFYNIGIGNTISKYESTNQANLSATKCLHDKQESHCYWVLRTLLCTLGTWCSKKTITRRECLN